MDTLRFKVISFHEICLYNLTNKGFNHLYVGWRSLVMDGDLQLHSITVHNLLTWDHKYHLLFYFSRDITSILPKSIKLIRYETMGIISAMACSYGKNRSPCICELNVNPQSCKVRRLIHCLRHEGPMLDWIGRETFLFFRAPCPPTRVVITIVLACPVLLPLRSFCWPHDYGVILAIRSMTYCSGLVDATL